MKPNNEISNARYYANSAEQQVLIQGLQRYFSLPERSQNRNKITKEVSQFLRCFSPHWTHRAVRLWFNNNKHSYFNIQTPTIENANDPANSFKNFSNYLQNNIKMNNTNFDPLLQNNPNIGLSNPLYFKAQMLQLPNPSNPQIVSMLSNPNLGQIPKNPNKQIIQESVTQPTLNSFQPIISTTIPVQNQEKLKPKKKATEKPEPPPQTEAKTQEQPKIKQLVIPQISKIQTNPATSTLLPPSQPLSEAKIPPKVAPKIPQPQIQPQNQFRKIPAPQIDVSLYKSGQVDLSKKKVNVMPPIKMSPMPSIQSLSNSNSAHQPLPLPSSDESADSILSSERLSKMITALLKEIRETPEDPGNLTSPLHSKIRDFERMCRDYRLHYGFLSPQIIDPSLKFTRFPSYEPLREIPSLSLSLADENDGYGFMYSDMGSLGNLSGFARSDSSFALNAFSPSPSMSLITGAGQRDDSVSNFQMFEKENSTSDLSEINSTGQNFTYSSSPSFSPSTSSSVDAAMSATPMNTSSSFQARQQDDAGGGFIDHVSPGNILQPRNFKNTPIPYFECVALSRGMETAAYAFLPVALGGQQQRAICFTTRSKQPDSMHESWKTVMVNCTSNAESMAVDADSAFLITNEEIVHSRLSDETDNSSRVEIPGENGSRLISILGKNDGSPGYGAAACFSSSSDILFVDACNNYEIQRAKTCLSGISCMGILSFDSIACSPPLGETITLLNRNGDEIRPFVGHCEPVMGIYPLFDSPRASETNLFASRSDDNTVRIWDIRERIPVFQITPSSSSLTNGSNGPSSKIQSTCSFLNVEGNNQYIMFSLHNQIGVVDIRKDFAKPVLGVVTDDYDAISLSYNQELNSVAMFGEISNIGTRDSMLFIGIDGQSRKRVFRTYSHFV